MLTTVNALFKSNIFFALLQYKVENETITHRLLITRIVPVVSGELNERLKNTLHSVVYTYTRIATAVLEKTKPCFTSDRARLLWRCLQLRTSYLYTRRLALPRFVYRSWPSRRGLPRQKKNNATDRQHWTAPHEQRQQKWCRWNVFYCFVPRTVNILSDTRWNIYTRQVLVLNVQI